MYKFMIRFVFPCAILITFVSPIYVSNGYISQSKSGLMPVTNGDAKLIDDIGLRHHIVSTNGMVIDTMTWCNGVPFADFGQYLTAYDSTVNWFKPFAPCSLYEVGGVFANSGTAGLFVCRYGYTSGDSSFPWPLTDNELPHEVLWTISGSGGWEEKDFRAYPRDQGFILQFPGDSLFAVGFGSDIDGKPYIMVDDYSLCDLIYPDENGVYHCTKHWSFTCAHPGFWGPPIHYWGPYRPPYPSPIWCPEIMMRAIVNYYEGVPPFVESTEPKSNTWLRESIKITALMSDLDGWLTNATLHYTVNG